VTASAGHARLTFVVFVLKASPLVASKLVRRS
jgi:hypothetical protein